MPPAFPASITLTVKKWISSLTTGHKLFSVLKNPELYETWIIYNISQSQESSLLTNLTCNHEKEMVKKRLKAIFFLSFTFHDYNFTLIRRRHIILFIFFSIRFFLFIWNHVQPAESIIIKTTNKSVSYYDLHLMGRIYNPRGSFCPVYQERKTELFPISYLAAFIYYEMKPSFCSKGIYLLSSTK